MALGALIIKARLGLTDEELVEQIKENPYLQFFIGLLREKLFPFDLLLGNGELVIREAEPLATHRPNCLIKPPGEN